MKKVITGEGIKIPNRKLNTALEVNGTIYTSGISPKNYVADQWEEGGMYNQAMRCLNNIKLIIDNAGASLEDIVWIEVFITDVRLYDEYNKAWNDFFADVKCPPTRSTVQVAGLLAVPMLIEMRAIAVKQS